MDGLCRAKFANSEQNWLATDSSKILAEAKVHIPIGLILFSPILSSCRG